MTSPTNGWAAGTSPLSPGWTSVFGLNTITKTPFTRKHFSKGPLVNSSLGVSRLIENYEHSSWDSLFCWGSIGDFRSEMVKWVKRSVTCFLQHLKQRGIDNNKSKRKCSPSWTFDWNSSSHFYLDNTKYNCLTLRTELIKHSNKSLSPQPCLFQGLFCFLINRRYSLITQRAFSQKGNEEIFSQVYYVLVTWSEKLKWIVHVVSTCILNRLPIN